MIEGNEATFVIDIVPVVDTPSISINRTGLESVREVITKITGETEPATGGGPTQSIDIIIDEKGEIIESGDYQIVTPASAIHTVITM